MTTIQLALFLCISIGYVLCDGEIFNWTLRMGLSNVYDIEYSPDQKYVAFASNQGVDLMDGASVFPADTVLYGNHYVFSCIGFSQDSSMFAVGFQSATNQSVVNIYRPTKQNSLIHSQKQSSRSLQPVQNSIITVKSLCWTSDNKRVIYSTSQGYITIFQAQKKISKSHKLLSNIEISSLACSPSKNLEFIIGATSDPLGKDVILRLYNINPLTNQIQEIHQFQVVQKQPIYSIAYDNVGTFFYRCSNNHIYMTQLDTYQSFGVQHPEGIAQFRKIRVSRVKNIKILAVSTAKNKLYIRKQIQDATQRNIVVKQQIQNITAPMFSLSSMGTNLLLASTMLVSMSQCRNGRFLNLQNDTCQPCNQFCRVCLFSGDKCHQCEDAHYLNNFQCKSCVSRCKQCINDTFCYTCYEPFTPLDSYKTCGCLNGKYVDGDKCSQCQNTCRTCLQNDSCTGCHPAHFLSNGKCEKCSDNCEQCQNLSKCDKCAQNYELNKNGACQQISNIPTWAIILIIILAVTLVGSITLIICLKINKLNKKNKESQLLTGSDEEISTDK